MDLKLSFILIFCFFAKSGTATLSDVNTNLNIIMLETMTALPVSKIFTLVNEGLIPYICWAKYERNLKHVVINWNNLTQLE
jgi:hypothetical protein